MVVDHEQEWSDTEEKQRKILDEQVEVIRAPCHQQIC
jgi:hypothetical protein